MASPPSLEEQLSRSTLSLRSLEVANGTLKHELVAAQREAHAAGLALERSRSEASAYSDFATREIESRDAALVDLKSRFEALQAGSARSFEEARAAAVAERAALEAEAAAREHALKLDLTEAKLQMERGLAFLEVQDELKRQVAGLQEKLVADADAHKLHSIEQERKFLSAKSEMQRQLAVMRSAIAGEARAEALATLSAEQRRVLKENKEMAGELVATSVEARHAAKELTGLAEGHTALKREVGELRAGEAMWAERCAANAVRAKAAEAARAEAEAAARAGGEAAAAQAAALRTQFSRESETLRAENAGLRELLDLKNRELRTVKRLALIVLQQRSEVEQFFLDALAEVKVEVIGRKRAAAAAALATATAELGASAARARLLQPAQALLRFLPPAPLHPPREKAPAGEEEGVSSVGGSTTVRPAGVTLQLARAKPETVRAAAAALTAAAGGSAPAPAPAPTAGASLPRAVTLASIAAAAASGAFEPERVAALGAGPSDVDLFDLRPEDRERVLRILFSRMGGAAAGRAAATPLAAAAATQRRAEAEALEALGGEEEEKEGRGWEGGGAGVGAGGGAGGENGAGAAAAAAAAGSSGEMRGPFGLAASLPNAR
jgi:hypothetical protein